ncbi:hypothetical protein FACS1894196_0760 [Clostridia bacterium]|nr:hypothetical protein FACS1894196_0760 [Clostridia bacterium]
MANSERVGGVSRVRREASIACYHHSDQIAVQQCVNCGKFLCQECAREAYDGVCGDCLAQAYAEEVAVERARAKSEIKSFIIAFAIATLSFVVSGIMVAADVIAEETTTYEYNFINCLLLGYAAGSIIVTLRAAFRWMARQEIVIVFELIFSLVIAFVLGIFIAPVILIRAIKTLRSTSDTE